MGARHEAGLKSARAILALRRGELRELVAALEEALDQVIVPYLRYRIQRWMELTSLLIIGIGEVLVAQTVVQAVGLTAVSTDLVALVVGGAATGLAWLSGHEWALGHDPRAVAAGRRGWLTASVAAARAFLMANLGVRIYYGLLAAQVDGLKSGPVPPLLAGALLTTVTAALMVVAAFITAHSETSKEAELRTRLRRARKELASLEKRLGVLRADPQQITPLRAVDE